MKREKKKTRIEYSTVRKKPAVYFLKIPNPVRSSTAPKRRRSRNAKTLFGFGKTFADTPRIYT